MTFSVQRLKCISSSVDPIGKLEWMGWIFFKETSGSQILYRTHVPIKKFTSVHVFFADSQVDS
jgi:hypothetical protein